jgi:hypothetical protein
MNTEQAKIIDQTSPLLLGNMGEHEFSAADPKPKILQDLENYAEATGGAVVEDRGEYVVLVPSCSNAWYRLYFKEEKLIKVTRCWGATSHERPYWDCLRRRDAGESYQYANYSQPLLEDLPDRAELEKQLERHSTHAKIHMARVRLYEEDELSLNPHRDEIAAFYGEAFQLELLGLLLLDANFPNPEFIYYWSKHTSGSSVKQSIWRFDRQNLAIIAARQGDNENPGKWAEI